MVVVKGDLGKQFVVVGSNLDDFDVARLRAESSHAAA